MKWKFLLTSKKSQSPQAIARGEWLMRLRRSPEKWLICACRYVWHIHVASFSFSPWVYFVCLASADQKPTENEVSGTVQNRKLGFLLRKKKNIFSAPFWSPTGLLCNHFGTRLRVSSWISITPKHWIKSALPAANRDTQTPALSLSLTHTNTHTQSAEKPVEMASPGRSTSLLSESTLVLIPHSSPPPSPVGLSFSLSLHLSFFLSSLPSFLFFFFPLKYFILSVSLFLPSLLFESYYFF